MIPDGQKTNHIQFQHFKCLILLKSPNGAFLSRKWHDHCYAPLQVGKCVIVIFILSRVLLVWSSCMVPRHPKRWHSSRMSGSTAGVSQKGLLKPALHRRRGKCWFPCWSPALRVPAWTPVCQNLNCLHKRHELYT